MEGTVEETFIFVNISTGWSIDEDDGRRKVHLNCITPSPEAAREQLNVVHVLFFFFFFVLQS